MEEDAELLTRWRARDRVAGNALFQRHFTMVHRFFANKVHNAAAAEDLVQQTFMRLAEKAVRFEGRSTFTAFVFGIAHNVLRESYRDRWRGVEPIGERSITDMGAGPSSVAVAREELQVLLDALRRVPLETQVLLELYYFEHIKGRELAEAIGICESTTRSRLRSAMERLRLEITKTAAGTPAARTLISDLATWMESLRPTIAANQARASASS